MRPRMDQADLPVNMRLGAFVATTPHYEAEP
jgi:hypothetical protein